MCFVRFILLIQDLIDPRLASTYVVEDGFELLIDPPSVPPKC